ncbi:Neutral and basic amino acid transport protein rBAT [Strongyloides ratti]|uniref:alpha-glucosidase n=1 Tax=Strongyloides ratti TaxID=34506 RepID=A0A090LTE6_STRRB|nr:Neutral and basic amino acid transport protein rBAT [Strongyloides ratti]CEF70894.1 Neutral and basic amino acid transport protein rBAT [Strongyloides ratti]
MTSPYLFEKGKKTESYITAVEDNPVNNKMFLQNMNNDDIEISNNATKPFISKNDDKNKPDKMNESYGLTAEELAPYGEDRTWKIIRIFLYVLFWLLWLAMVGGIVALILLNPPCSNVREKRNLEWWEKSLIYQIWTPSFKDSDADGLGDFKGINEKLSSLEKINIDTIFPRPFLKINKDDNEVIDYFDVNTEYGNLEDAENLIKSAHDKGIYVIIEIPISVTSNKHIWFKKSSKGSSVENSSYSDFYYWKQNAEKSQYASNYEDTNILYWHKKDKPNSPILNWKSSGLKEAMYEVFKFWIKKGIDGFYLSSPKYIARSLDATKPDFPEIVEVFQELKNEIDNYIQENEDIKDKKIFIFTSADDMTENEKKQLGINGGLDALINYELGNVEKDSKICYKLESTVAGCVNEILSDILIFHNNNPQIVPIWEFGNPSTTRLSTRVQSRLHSEILIMLQMMLPGSNMFYYGDIIGIKNLKNNNEYKNVSQMSAMQWDDTINGGFTQAVNSIIPVQTDIENINWEKQLKNTISPLRMFKRIAKIKKRVDAFKYGKAYVGTRLQQAFTISRFDTDEQRQPIGHVYVCAANFGKETTTLPLDEIPGASSITLKNSQIFALTTKAYETYDVREKVDLSSQSLTIGPQQAIIFKFLV